MLERYKLLGDLKIGQYKTIKCLVNLHIESIPEEKPANFNPNDWVNGFKIGGELSFDSSPINVIDKHPVKRLAVGDLILREGGDSTKCKIVFIDKAGETVVEKNKIKRYFWAFFVPEAPSHDGLEIFPKFFNHKREMRVFYCTDFRGIWPIGVSSVVVANDPIQAKKILLKAFEDAGIYQPEAQTCTLNELDVTKAQAIVLNDGTY